MEPVIIQWHRLFGLGLTDLFTGTGFSVELELDLSLKKQLLDAIVIEGEPPASLPEPPDGLEELSAHNLITYKSMHESLGAFALDELLGHFVNYRKLRSPDRAALVPEGEFRLFAVTTAFPEKLAGRVPLTPRKPGVYEVTWGVRPVRVIVTREVERAPRNAFWELFSSVPDRVREGARWYHWKRDDLSQVLNKLFERYQAEGLAMPYTVEDFKRELVKEVATTTPPEELLKWIPPEKLLKGLPPEERLKGLPPEERLKGLPPEERLKGIPPEEMLKRLSREEILEYLTKLEQGS